jgi:hypothetical protein
MYLLGLSSYRIILMHGYELFKKYTEFFLYFPRARLLYRIEGSHPPGHPVRATALSGTIKWVVSKCGE